MESIAALTNDDIRTFTGRTIVLPTSYWSWSELYNRNRSSGSSKRCLAVGFRPVNLACYAYRMLRNRKPSFRSRVPLPEKSQVDLYWGTLGPSRTSPDYYAARMADLVLGRLGLMGRLGDRIRDELGLAYYVSSHLESGQGPVAWRISAGVRASDIARTVEEIRSEVRHLRQTLITDEELADCRSYLIGSMPSDLETNSDIAEHILA